MLETLPLMEFENIIIRNFDDIRVIIAVHNTKAGVAIGGCRIRNYETFDEQLKDTLRLAEGMTYKNMFAGLPHGGGKATVSIPEGMQPDNDKVINAIADSVDSLNGEYYTAKDVGVTPGLLDALHNRTKYVLGRYAGDPSLMTAWGVYYGIMASLEFAGYFSDEAERERYNTGEAITIAIEGLGGVGLNLAKILGSTSSTRFHLIVQDIDESKYSKIESMFDVADQPIKTVNADVYCPCALGGTVDENWKDIQAPIIAGAANNQIINNHVALEIFESGKIYAPDFVINSGGVIYAAQEFLTKDKEIMYTYGLEKAKNIRTSLLSIFEESKNRSLPTNEVAIEMAIKELNG